MRDVSISVVVIVRGGKEFGATEGLRLGLEVGMDGDEPREDSEDVLAVLTAHRVSVGIVLNRCQHGGDGEVEGEEAGGGGGRSHVEGECVEPADHVKQIAEIKCDLF